MDMRKVLIAEDDVMIADMIEAVLVAHGYEICGIATTVAEAIEVARRSPPDFAVIDHRLADGDLGTDVANYIHELGHVGVLYATGNVRELMATAVTGHACISKPYSEDDLLRGLEIVSEIVTTGKASPPFPRGFKLMPMHARSELAVE